jgi:hypothetical protein
MNEAQRQARAALRAKMRAAREVVRARLQSHPQVAAARQRRRMRRVAALVVMLLLLLLVRCDCGPAAVGAAVDVGPRVPDAGLVPVDAGAVRRKLAMGSTRPTPRPDFETPVGRRPAWLDALRAQVSARSRRLAECLTALERTGALRWTAAITLPTGVVADQSFEPVSGSVALNDEQKRCLTAVLAGPNYLLPASDAGVDPQRVSLVIEF